MAEENPLVAKTNSGSWTGAANVGNADQAFEGSGLFADVHSTISDGAKGNWGGVAMDAAGDAMDALGTAMDPLGSLDASGPRFPPAGRDSCKPSDRLDGCP